jgi:hypothetical protein
MRLPGADPQESWPRMCLSPPGETVRGLNEGGPLKHLVGCGLDLRGSPNEAARIHCDTWQRGGVADRGARAAAGDAVVGYSGSPEWEAH